MAFAIVSGLAPRHGVPVFTAAIETAGHRVIKGETPGGVTVEVAGSRKDAERAVTAALAGVKANSIYGIAVKYIGTSDDAAA